MNPIIAFIKLIRLPNLLIIALVQYAIRFGIIYPYGLELQMKELDFFLLCLSTVMISAAGYIINDYFDLKVDRVNRPTKIIVGKYIKRRVAMGAHILINVLACVTAVYVAYKVQNLNLIGIQVISIAALWYYSTWLKKKVLLGNLIIAILAGLVPFIAGWYELTLQHANAKDIVNGLLFFMEEETPYDLLMNNFLQSLNNILKWIMGFSIFAFLSTIVREIIKDMEDYEGDKKYGYNTFAVVYGIKPAKITALLISAVMLTSIAYIQYLKFKHNDMLSVMYMSFAIQIPLIYVFYKLVIARAKNDFSHLSLVMKLIMLAGISYSLLFYYLVINL